MSLAVIWSPLATARLATISSWQLRAEIDRAVMTFAGSGVGHVVPATPHPNRYRLRHKDHVVVFFVDVQKSELHVLTVYRRVDPPR